MKLKTILTFLYLCISTLVFLFFKAEFSVWISFFVNFILITAITYFHLNIEKTYSPFLTSFIVFFYLFGIVAPVIQISSFDEINSVFPTNYPYNTWSIIYANILIFTFCSIFFVCYLYFKKRYNINYIENITDYKTTYSTPL